MIVIEYKLKGKLKQYQAIDEAIRTCQFIRNKSIRYWMDNKKVGKYDLSKLSTKLGKEFDFAKRLNSTARQSSAESMIIVGKILRARRAFLSFLKTLVLLNTNSLDGSSTIKQRSI